MTSISNLTIAKPSIVTLAARAAYARLSKDKTKRSPNVAIQLQEVHEYALDTGEPIPAQLVFKDNDLSASTFGTKPREGYLDLLEAIRAGSVSKVIITEVPRLCRQTAEATELISLSRTTEFRGVITTDGMEYDLRTPRGRKAFRDAVSDAEFETDQISVRQHRKKNKQAEAGAYHGGIKAHGYAGAIYEKLVTPDGETINGRLLNPGDVGCLVIKEEAAVRQECTMRTIAGEKEADLVKDMNTRGVPAPGGGRWRIGNMRRWLLHKRAVAFDKFPGPGTRLHKGKEYSAVWDAIIAKEDYELMVAAIKLGRKENYNGRPKGRTYLLSGMCHCGRCGTAMYGKGRVDKGKYQRRYGCRARDSFGERLGCGKVFRNAEPVDLVVWEQVVSRFDTPEVAAALAPSEDEDRLKELVELQTRQRLHLETLVSDYGAGILSREELIIAKQAASEQLGKTEAELAKIQRAKAAILPAGQTLQSMADEFGIEWQRQVISLLVDYIEILPGLPRGKTWRGYRFDPTSVRITWKV